MASQVQLNSHRLGYNNENFLSLFASMAMRKVSRGFGSSSETFGSKIQTSYAALWNAQSFHTQPGVTIALSVKWHLTPIPVLFLWFGFPVHFLFCKSLPSLLTLLIILRPLKITYNISMYDFFLVVGRLRHKWLKIWKLAGCPNVICVSPACVGLVVSHLPIPLWTQTASPIR